MLYLFIDILINKIFYFNSYLFLIPLIYHRKNFVYYLVIGLTLDIFICNSFLNTIILSLLYLINKLLIKIKSNEVIYFINYLFYYSLISLIIGHTSSLLDLFNLIINLMIFKIWDIYHHRRIKLIG